MAIIEGVHGQHQHIHGAIERGGDKYFGEGFSSRKLKEGTYLIEFEQPFKEIPAPVCTIFGYEWHTFNKSVAVVDVSPSHCICVTSTPDRPEDCGFTFLAFGDV